MTMSTEGGRPESQPEGTTTSIADADLESAETGRGLLRRLAYQPSRPHLMIGALFLLLGLLITVVVISPSDDESEWRNARTEDLVQVLDDLSALEREFDQSTEDAVAEAVVLAQKFEAERDELRELAQRVQADFENYKRRVAAQQAEQRERAAEDLVKELLTVLDTCDAAVGQGHEQVLPVRDQLLATLQKLGLSQVAQAEVAFDPNVHEAVLHDEGGADDEDD